MMEITSGIQPKPIKAVIYGPEGIGKSTFAAQAPYPIWCDVEDSTRFMDVRRLPKPNSAQMIMEEINYIRCNPQLCDTFVLDTADWTEKLCREMVCDRYAKTGIEDFGFGKGYSYVFEEFGKLLNATEALIQAGINVIVTAHAALRKFEQPEEMGAYDRWELKLINTPKCSVANMLKEWADLVLFANYETIVVKTKSGKAKGQGGERVMYTSHHPCWDAKNRFGLPEKLPFDFGQVAGLFYSKSTMRQPALQPDLQAVPEPIMQTPLQPVQQLSVSKQQTVNQSGAQSLAQQEYPIVEDEDCPFEGPTDAGGISKALKELMTASGVTEEEVTAAVAEKGYFPRDMRLCEYPPDFVSGVLVGAWEQVVQMIKNGKGE